MNKYLIVGLGNIGQEYEDTRHNIGFKVLDHLTQNTTSFERVHLADVAKYKLKNTTLILIKPTTYMNLSGKAVVYWLKKENVDPDNLLVITDDIYLPFGRIRIKKDGTDGGHNGLKDIQQKLNTSVYKRLRFGIGGDFPKGNQVDYVLGVWSQTEHHALKDILLEYASNAVKTFALEGIDKAMNRFNTKLTSP